MSSSDDPLQQLKDQVFNSNKKVAPKAVLISVTLNAALSVRSQNTPQPLLFDNYVSSLPFLAL